MTAFALARTRSPFARVASPVPLVPRIAIAVLVVIVAAAILGPLVAPTDPNTVDISSVFGGPSSAHWLGTDESGRDLFSRLLVGARSALVGSSLVIAVAGAAGVVLSLIAAWRGGVTDTAVARLFDVLLAFPGLLLAIIAASVYGASLSTAALALSISYVPYIGRVVRAEALRQRSLPYVDAAWIGGMSGLTVCRKHLMPNLTPTIVAQLTTAFGYATIDLAAISFLGLGVQPPTADWGTMVAAGQTGVQQGHPQQSLYAGACLVILILCCTVLGDHLGDRADRRA